MAVLTSDELAFNRQGDADGEVSLDWDKATINAAIQALEDWYETSGRVAASTAIDAATAPYVFSNPIKKKIGRWWFRMRFDKGG